MMISTKGRYALRVMLDLAQHDSEGYISVKTIAERQQTSPKYLEAIISILNKAGLVDSTRGKAGGYKLAKPPAAYRIADILTKVEGSLAPVACLDCQENPCDREDYCLTQPMWKQLDRLIEDYLKSITLDQLLNQDLPSPCFGCSAKKNDGSERV